MRTEIVPRRANPDSYPASKSQDVPPKRLDESLKKNRQELGQRYANCTCPCPYCTGKTGMVDHCEGSSCLNGGEGAE